MNKTPICKLLDLCLLRSTAGLDAAHDYIQANAELQERADVLTVVGAWYFQQAIQEVHNHKAFRDAVHWLRRAATVQPLDTRTYYLLGLCYELGLLDYEQAFVELHKAIELNPYYASILVNVASVLYGVPEDVITLEESIQLLERATKLEPDNWIAFARLSDRYQEADRAFEAGQAWRKSILLSTPSEERRLDLLSAVKQDNVEHILYIAGLLRNYRQYEAAAEKYHGAIGKVGEQPDVLAALADCHYALAYPSESFRQLRGIEWVEQMVANGDTSADLMIVIQSYHVTRPVNDPRFHYKEALRLMERAATIAHTDARLHYMLGKYLSHSNLQLAASKYRRAIELNAVFGSALFAAAELYDKASGVVSLPEAVDWTERALKVSPDNPIYHFQLGNLYRKAEREEDAIESWSKALLCAESLDEEHLKIIEDTYCRAEQGLVRSWHRSKKGGSHHKREPCRR